MEDLYNQNVNFEIGMKFVVYRYCYSRYFIINLFLTIGGIFWYKFWYYKCCIKINMLHMLFKT